MIPSSVLAYFPYLGLGLGVLFSILALRLMVAPPTLNLEDPSVETKLDLAPLKKREREITYALSNSFGFGGTNASLVFGRAPES